MPAFTPNLNLFRPFNGEYVGTWDVPVNSNWDTLDGVLGGTVNVALGAVPITLAPAQYNNAIINFTGALSADVTVTMPPVGRTYVLVNSCTNSVSFRVTIACSTPTAYICLPPSEPTAALTVNGNTVSFTGLGRVGTYWDFGGSAVPRWVTGSSPQPYLNCDGTAFSSAAYPALRDYLGVATLPDARGRYRAALNQGTGRTTGINGNVILSAGGSETIAQANLPNYALPVTDPGHVHPYIQAATNGQLYSIQSLDTGAFQTGVGNNTTGAFTGITVNSGGTGTAYQPPGYIGGLTLIRAG